MEEHISAKITIICFNAHCLYHSSLKTSLPCCLLVYRTKYGISKDGGPQLCFLYLAWTQLQICVCVLFGMASLPWCNITFFRFVLTMGMVLGVFNILLYSTLKCSTLEACEGPPVTGSANIYPRLSSWLLMGTEQFGHHLLWCLSKDFISLNTQKERVGATDTHHTTAASSFYTVKYLQAYAGIGLGVCFQAGVCNWLLPIAHSSLIADTLMHHPRKVTRYPWGTIVYGSFLQQGISS